MSERYEIRLAGTGGQGLILAGLVIAEAAIMSGRDAVMSQAYGAEARGGASKAEVIISKTTIFYPKIYRPDVLLALDDRSYLKYGSKVKDDGIVILDEFYAPAVKEVFDHTKLVPVSNASLETTGKVTSTNMAAVGVVAALLGFLPREICEEAIAMHVPKHTIEGNILAFRRGLEIMEQMI